MRVTENSGYGTVRESIQRSKQRLENLQSQSATLKKLNTPSDDPVGSSKVLEIRTDKVNNDQFHMNGKMAETYLENSEQALGELAELVLRAKEIAVGQSSGASANEDTRRAIAEEVRQLYEQAIATANRRIGERYLFGGYQIDKPPVDRNGKYQGDEGQIMVEVGKNVFISANVPGHEVFNASRNSAIDSFGEEIPPEDLVRIPASNQRGVTNYTETAPSNGGVNVFDELQNLRIALLTSDVQGIQNTLERFDEMHGSLNASRAKIGSRLQGLKTMGQAMERHNLINAQLVSNIEDADMAQVMSDMAKEETVFRNVLQSSSKLIHPTLMDFLK